MREARKAIRQARAAERKRIVASPAEAAAGHVEDADAASKTPASSPTKESSPGPKLAAPKVTASSSPSRKKASSSSPKSIQRAAVPASHALTTENTMRIRAVWRDRIIGRRRTFVVCSGLKSLAKAKIQIRKLRDGGNYRRLHQAGGRLELIDEKGKNTGVYGELEGPGLEENPCRAGRATRVLQV